MTKQILINGTSYTLRYTLKNYFMFEELTNRPFVFGKLVDEILLFYSTLLANNEYFSLEFEEFIALCDDNPNLYNEFKVFYVACLKLEAQKLTTEDANNVKKKKKQKPKQ